MVLYCNANGGKVRAFEYENSFENKKPFVLFQMREIATKMERVDREFQRRDMTIIKLDEKLRHANQLGQKLAQALDQSENQNYCQNRKIEELNFQIQQHLQTVSTIYL